MDGGWRDPTKDVGPIGQRGRQGTGGRVRLFDADSLVDQGKDADMLAARTILAAKVESHPFPLLWDADTLACRSGSGFQREVIEIEGHGPYYHVARFYRSTAGVPMIVEMFDDTGGRTMPLADWLAARAAFVGGLSEVVDVFRPDLFGSRGYQRRVAVEWMLRNIVGKPYGKATIRRFARQSSWLTCWWNPTCCNEDAPPPTDWVCSTSVAGSDKYGGGCHPVAGLWIGDTSPTALVRGHLYDYRLSIPLRTFAPTKA
ncbi:MAG: hypothetical protein ACLQLG_18685 [Thermoguttaceae bacterium]